MIGLKGMLVGGGLLVTALGASAMYNIKQAQDKGELRQQCETEKEAYRADAKTALQEAKDAAEERWQEALTEREERVEQLENRLATALERKEEADREITTLMREHRQDPEVVTWLDTPVPEQLFSSD